MRRVSHNRSSHLEDLSQHEDQFLRAIEDVGYLCLTEFIAIHLEGDFCQALQNFLSVFSHHLLHGPACLLVIFESHEKSCQIRAHP